MSSLAESSRTNRATEIRQAAAARIAALPERKSSAILIVLSKPEPPERADVAVLPLPAPHAATRHAADAIKKKELHFPRFLAVAFKAAWESRGENNRCGDKEVAFLIKPHG